MTFEEQLDLTLRQDAGIAALVGDTNGTTRVYPLALPQGVSLPAITYQVITNLREHSHSGYSGLAAARVQVTAWAATYGAAKQLGAAVRRALVGPGPGGISIDEQDVGDAAVLADGTRLFGVANDIQMWVTEAV